MNPPEWKDPTTGRQVRRVSSTPGSASLYFNFNAYTPQGDYLLIQTPTGISKIALATFEETPVIAITSNFRVLFVGRKTRTVYWQNVLEDPWNGGTVYAVDIDSGVQREIVQLDRGHVQDINCDETLLAVVELDKGVHHPVLETLGRRNSATDQVDYNATWPNGTPMSYADAKELRLNERLEAKLPMTIFTINTVTGSRTDIYSSNDWLNHLLFSPTDPNLLMYCHEGAWHKVDRLWLIRLGDKTPTKVHTRTMDMEIAGHEWWSQDGKIIWYDLQQPRGEVFCIAGYDVETGERTRYCLNRNEWSVHYHSNATNTLFSGDGADSEMVARGDDAKWIYLFRPEQLSSVAGLDNPSTSGLIHPGVLKSEKLMRMDRQDYRLEPNCNFTPNGEWLVFNGNFEGERHVYAVDVQ